METVKIKNSRNLNLVGDLYTADSDKIIIMSHGFAYDRHKQWDNFGQIIETLNKVGYNILTFDFSGSGESDDDSISVGKEVDDLKSVIKFAREKGYNNIILLAMSLGGLISLSAYDEDIKAMILISPVTQKVDSGYRHHKFSKEQLSEFKENGQLVYYIDNAIRKKIIIDRQYILDREELNSKLLLRNIKCPVLIFHGDEDGIVSFKDSQKSVKMLGNKGELYIVKGEGHSFRDSTEVIVNKTINWLAKKV